MRGCINHGMGLTIPNMSHEPGVPKDNHQEPVSSTYDCLTLIPKDTFPKSNRQEPVGSTSDCITILLMKIRHMFTQNNISAPFINNMNEIDITQNCNILHRKYVDITKNM